MFLFLFCFIETKFHCSLDIYSACLFHINNLNFIYPILFVYYFAEKGCRGAVKAIEGPRGLLSHYGLLNMALEGLNMVVESCLNEMPVLPICFCLWRVV